MIYEEKDIPYVKIFCDICNRTLFMVDYNLGDGHHEIREPDFKSYCECCHKEYKRG